MTKNSGFIQLGDALATAGLFACVVIAFLSQEPVTLPSLTKIVGSLALCVGWVQWRVFSLTRDG